MAADAVEKRQRISGPVQEFEEVVHQVATHVFSKDASVDDVVRVAASYMETAAGLLQCSTPKIRVCPAAVQEMLVRMSEGPAMLVMRHGEQLKSAACMQLLDAADRKIRMMRDPDNMLDPATAESAAIFLGFIAVAQFLQQTTGKHIVVRTSANMRASQLAHGLSKGLGIAAAEVAEELSCMKYKPHDPEDVNDERFKREALRPDGTVAWDRNAIAAACTDEEFFDRILSVTKRLADPTALNADIAIVLTHTQQIDGVKQHLQVEGPARLGNFGYVLVSQSSAGEVSGLLRENGIFESSVGLSNRH